MADVPDRTSPAQTPAPTPAGPAGVPEGRRVFVECPPEWGPGRVLIGRLESLGYQVADRRGIGGAAERRLHLS